MVSVYTDVEQPSPADLLQRVRSLPAVAALLERLGEQPDVFLVGGSVRDLLLGASPTELDLVVESDAAALAKHIGASTVTHERFGTSTVRLDGFRYDVARARRETYSRPGALPDIEPATLQEDLRRRDFTVNAMAVALAGPEAGVLRTVSLAPADLAARQLRILHDRSFIDDPTRLLRLVRYRARLGFEVEPRTLERARAAVGAGALDTVSGARVGAELRLLAAEADPLAALLSLRELGLDAVIHPNFGVDDPELARRSLALLPEDGRRQTLMLALASHRLSGPELVALLDRLTFTASDREAISLTALDAERLAATLAATSRPSEIAAAIGPRPSELVALAGALGPADAAHRWLDHYRHVRLEIDGRDLISAGIPEGPAVGRGLRAALYAKLDGRASGRDAELLEALSAAR